MEFNIKKLFEYAQRPPIDATNSSAFWDDEHISKGMLAAHLNPEIDAASRKSETIDASIRWISEDLNLLTGAKVLDLGCGPGLYASRLAKLGYQVTGMDFSRRSIAYAKEQARQNQQEITYIYQDYLTLDYENEFDLITLIYGDLGVLSDEDRDHLIRQVHRALKPGGIFLFDVFTGEKFKDQSESQSWSVEESGFWAPIPHIYLQSHYIYPEHDTHMDQHIILDEAGNLEVYHIRDHYYSQASISRVLEACGFQQREFFSDVTGKEWVQGSESICVVAPKKVSVMTPKLEQLLHNYNLGEIQEVTPLDAGHVCTNYKIVTDEDTYVLRIRPDYFSLEDLHTDHRFLNFLSENNFPAPKAIPNRQGSTSGLTPEGQPYEVQTYIAHNKNLTHYPYQQISNQLAHFLGKYHEIATQYPEQVAKPAYVNGLPIGFFEKYFDGPLDAGVERYRQTAAVASEEISRELTQRIDRLASKLRQVRAQMEAALPEIPQLVNHNDFYGNNILLADEQILGLVDFDFCSTGPYYIDLVELMHGSVIWHDEEMPYWGLHPEGEVRWEHGRQDLQAYFANRSEVAFDEQLFREFLKVKIISLAFYPAFDMVETAEDRLEVARRLERVMATIDEMGPLR